MNVQKLLYLFFFIPTFLTAQRILPKVEVEWDKNFGGEQSEIFYKVIENRQGEYAAVGRVELAKNDTDVYLVITNESGVPILQKQYSGDKQYGKKNEDAAFSIIEALDGGYLMAGYSSASFSDSLVEKNAKIWKIDEAGEILWEAHYGETGANEWRDLIQLKDENIIVTGQKNSNLWLAKLNPRGKIIWEHSLKGFPSIGNSIALTAEEEIIVAGDIQVLNKKIGSQITMVKADQEGNVFWVNNYDDEGARRSTDVIVLDNGDLAVTGHAVSRVYREDMFLMITDQNGLVKVAKAYGGKKSDGGGGLAQAANGDLYLGGFSKERTDPNDSGWVNRVSAATGERVWKNDRQNFLTNKYSDHIYDIIVSSDGSPIMVGMTKRLGKGEDAWLVKLATEGLPSVITPPTVTVSEAQLIDANRDTILSAHERGYISFEISNTSSQTLYNVQARSSTNSPQDIEIVPVMKIGKILAESTITVALPVKSGGGVTESVHRIAVDFLEANNADIPSLVVELKTGFEVLETEDEN